MGMFDEVYANCPWCEAEIVMQTKCGPCDLSSYYLDEPDLNLGVAWGVQDEKQVCESCGKPSKAKLISHPLMKMVKIREEDPEDEQDY